MVSLKPQPIHWILLALVTAVFVWSGIEPRDRFTWFMEVFPVILAAAILIGTWRRFPLTNLIYVAIAIHAIILMIGGRYTYAEVPFGFWMERVFGFTRNHYDRIGHFAQGFVPALVAREILVRLSVVRRRGWLTFIVVSICLAISASYEFLEWWTAVAVGAASEAFLGTQGDPWDTQTDMFMALIGAVSAMLLLSGIQDRFIDRLRGNVKKLEPPLMTN